jgi:hypothetical protein
MLNIDRVKPAVGAAWAHPDIAPVKKLSFCLVVVPQTSPDAIGTVSRVSKPACLPPLARAHDFCALLMRNSFASDAAIPSSILPVRRSPQGEGGSSCQNPSFLGAVSRCARAALVRLNVETTSPGVRRSGFQANLLGRQFRFKTLPKRLLNRMGGCRIRVWHWTCNSPP